MRYYIIAGEASGDLHAGHLVEALVRRDPEAVIRAWGGERLAAAGAEVVKHYRDLAFMGFVEVVKNLPSILRNLRFCIEDIQAFQPDVVIMVDYPGFNLRIARKLRAIQFPTKIFYYISPQVWAWHSSRVPMMKEVLDELYCILGFEQEYYAKEWDWKVHFYGHPLLDEIKEKQSDLTALQAGDIGLEENRPIIALLPGSRKQEVSRMLPMMLNALAHYKEQYQIAIAAVPSLDSSIYQSLIEQSDLSTVKLVVNKTYELLHLAEVAVVTSGTATLETALIGTPQVVCYKTNTISYHIAKRLVKLDYFSLVNLIAGRSIVGEFLQEEANASSIAAEVRKLLQPKLPNQENTSRAKMLADYAELKKLLGGEGSSERVAVSMLEQIKKGS